MEEKKSCLDYCPFTGRACTECGVYRGRHRHIVSAGHERVPAADSIAEYFKAVARHLSPWTGESARMKEKPKITLKVVNMENRQTRICEFTEARAWDWGDPTMMRLIDGWHVKSFDNLVDILCYKEQKGHREAELQECPRFMLLSGG